MMRSVLVNNKSRKIFIALACSLLTISFCLPFFAGYFSSSKKIEEISQYTSTIVETCTNDSNYLAITVGSGDENLPILNPYDEFHRLYGTFRQEQASFGSGVNFFDANTGMKEHSVFIEDYNGNIASPSLSMFYLGPVGSSEYNGHFKHYVYPFELMFEDSRNYDVSKYLAYISQTHADKLLDSLGESRENDGKYAPEQYHSLIRKKVNMIIDSSKYEYVINNIYYEHNYYYSAINEVFSDFILTSYFAPGKLMQERKNIYFMTKYSYQNRYYMEYINKAYESKLYDVSINKNNVINPIDDQIILDFFYSDRNAGSFSVYIFLIIVYYTLLVLSLSLLMIFRFDFSVLHSLIVGFCVIIPYIIFFIVFIRTESISFFTKAAGLNYFIGLSIVFLVLVVWHFLHKYILGKHKIV